MQGSMAPAGYDIPEDNIYETSIQKKIWRWLRNLSSEELMLLNCGAGEDSWESLGQRGDQTSPS